MVYTVAHLRSDGTGLSSPTVFAPSLPSLCRPSVRRNGPLNPILSSRPTSVGDLSLAFEVGLVGDDDDGCGRVLVCVALQTGQHGGHVVERLAVRGRVQQNEPVHVAVVTLVGLHAQVGSECGLNHDLLFLPISAIESRVS